MKKKKTLNNSVICSDDSEAATLTCESRIDPGNKGAHAFNCKLNSAVQCVDISIIHDSNSGKLLKNITVLALDSLGITEIIVSAPENLSGIDLLNLCGNQISDVSALISLKDSLTTLDLSYNKISDITDLAPQFLSIGPITSLSLKYNNIIDASPLAKVYGLMALGLTCNSITDTDTLKPLAKTLITLDVCGNPDERCPLGNKNFCVTCYPGAC